MRAQIILQVKETSYVGEARRQAASLAESLDFDETHTGHVSIIVTELATNLLKHAGGGEIILRAIQDGDLVGIETISLDKGPGIRNIGESLRDGYSTVGSPGTGLGAIQRLSSVFDLYSPPGQGLVVLSRIWRQTDRIYSPVTQLPADVGVVCLPLWGEERCGDNWSIYQSSGRAMFMLADWLGHGLYASEASSEAKIIFKKYINESPAQIMTYMHSSLRRTRGAAVVVAELLFSQRLLRFVGVGNISGRIISDSGIQNLVSYNGTVGLEARRIQEFIYPWPDDGVLILHSDGLASHWSLDNYPGLRGRSPGLIAGVLYRDHKRERDDTSVLVAREVRSQKWA